LLPQPGRTRISSPAVNGWIFKTTRAWISRPRIQLVPSNRRSAWDLASVGVRPTQASNEYGLSSTRQPRFTESDCTSRNPTASAHRSLRFDGVRSPGKRCGKSCDSVGTLVRVAQRKKLKTIGSICQTSLFWNWIFNPTSAGKPHLLRCAAGELPELPTVKVGRSQVKQHYRIHARWRQPDASPES
jgi:hypothetical protein